MAKVRRVLFVSGSRGSATLRYRVRQAQEALATHGIASHASYYLDGDAGAYLAQADVLALYRTPATDWLAALVARAQQRGIPVTFDIDDLVFTSAHLTDLEIADSLSEFELAEIPRRAVAATWAGCGSGSSAVIASDLAQYVAGATTVIPNGVGRVGLDAAQRAVRQESRQITLGYFSGSRTHDKDWRTIESDVVAVLAAHPQARLRIVGDLTTGSQLADVAGQVEHLPRQSWLELYDVLANTDINLAPLTNSRFTTGKSAIKWLEAALTATPTIATATEPHRAAIIDGITGVLIEPGHSWIAALTTLIGSSELRRAIGRAAQHAALAEFGPEQQADRYRAYFTEAAQTGAVGHTIRTRRALVPKIRNRLEPYPFASPLPSWQANRRADLGLRITRIAQAPARLRNRG